MICCILHIHTLLFTVCSRHLISPLHFWMGRRVCQRANYNRPSHSPFIVSEKDSSREMILIRPVLTSVVCPHLVNVSINTLSKNPSSAFSSCFMSFLCHQFTLQIYWISVCRLICQIACYNVLPWFVDCVNSFLVLHGCLSSPKHVMCLLMSILRAVGRLQVCWLSTDLTVYKEKLKAIIFYFTWWFFKLNLYNRLFKSEMAWFINLIKIGHM